MSSVLHMSSVLPPVLATAAIALASWAAFKFWQLATVPKRAPLIGMSRDIAWHGECALSTKNYELMLTRAGARILDLSPDTNLSTEEILDKVDGLLIAAGGDVNPKLYNGEFGPDSQCPTAVDDARDEFELALVRGALERDMPLMGVCRGHQLINVALGGTLMCLRDDKILFGRHGPGIHSLDAHGIDIVPGSYVAKLMPKTKGQTEPTFARVSSFHGAAVRTAGHPLRVVARCSEDGGVEATEHPTKRFVITMQFHAEFPPWTMMEFYDEFISKAIEYRAERSRTDSAQSRAKRLRN